MPVPTAAEFAALVGRIAESDGQLGDLIHQVVAKLDEVKTSDAASKAILESASTTLTTVADNQDALEATLKNVVNPATPVDPVPPIPEVPPVEPIP